MPAVKSKVHLNDPSWITPEFKTLIAKRQQAFMSGDLASFRHLRNTVNRERKALRERFFASKVKHLKNTKPSQWWGEVKRIAGMTPASGSDNLRSLLHVEGLDHHLPDRDVANAINSAFLDQMKSFSPLDATLPFEANSAVVTIVICVAYYVIWRKQKSPICNHKNVIREAKLANTSFLITGASVFTLLPFQILNLLVYLQITANFSHLQPTVLVIRVLQDSNSFVNVIIYSLRIPEFKNCLLHLLRCCVVPHQIFRAGVLPSAESGSVVSLVRFTSTQHLSPSSKQESAF